MYEKFSHPGLLGMEGDPPTRDNFSPYKQALSIKLGIIQSQEFAGLLCFFLLDYCDLTELFVF